MKRKHEEGWIEKFTRREEELLARGRAVNLVLSDRLLYWTFWIQDSVMYLNELRNAVEDAEKAHKETA